MHTLPSSDGLSTADTRVDGSSAAELEPCVDGPRAAPSAWTKTGYRLARCITVHVGTYIYVCPREKLYTDLVASPCMTGTRGVMCMHALDHPTNSGHCAAARRRPRALGVRAVSTVLVLLRGWRNWGWENRRKAPRVR